MNPIEELSLPEKCRIIVVSDIHTSCELLDKMLKRASYDPEKDYLIIIGDILEHWHNNINTLSYVYKLCKHEKAICLLGNNDFFAVRMAFEYPYERFAEKFYYNENTFFQMARSAGYKNCSEENWLDIRRTVLERYGKQLEWLRGLPVCIESDRYVFVHAGVENRADWHNTDNNFAVTVPWFLRKDNPTGKWLVVGHFPTYNYKRSNASNLPIIDESKKIIDIDGGLSIKKACQMNFLMIHKNGDSYTNEIMWDAPFEKRSITKDFECELRPVYVDWSNQDIEIISEKDGIIYVKGNVTGGKGYIPKHKVYENDGKLHIYQFLSSFPKVKRGEQVFVCEENNGLSLVITERAVVGWIPSDIID